MAENISAPNRAGPNRAVLEKLIQRQFAPDKKAERVAKALAALDQEEPIKLSPEEWKWVAEDAELEDPI